MHLKCLVEEKPLLFRRMRAKNMYKAFSFFSFMVCPGKKAEEGFFQTFECKTYDLSLGLYIASKRWCIPNILQFLTEHFLMYAAACCMITLLGIKLNIIVTIDWRKEFLQCTMYVFLENILCFKFFLFLDAMFFMRYQNI